MSASGVAVTTKDDPPTVSGSLETSVSSEYLANVGMVIDNKSIATSELKLRFRSGWYLGIWGGFPLQKKSPVSPEEGARLEIDDPMLAGVDSIIGSLQKIKTALNPPKPVAVPFDGEVDLYVGYKLQLTDWSIDTALLFYNFNDVGKYNDDQLVVQSGVTYEGFKHTKPWVQADYYIGTGHLAPKDSFYLYAGIDQVVKLYRRNDGSEQTLNLGVSTAWSDGELLGVSPGFDYVRAKANIELVLWKNASLIPSLLFQHNLTDGKFAKENELVGGLAFDLKF